MLAFGLSIVWLDLAYSVKRAFRDSQKKSDSQTKKYGYSNRKLL
jgi:hypothetical protein